MVERNLTADEQAAAMVDFIKRDILKSAGADVDVNTPLFSTGLLDSLSAVVVVHHLEDVTNRRLPAARLRPKDIDTVALMLGVAGRLGKPRS